MTITARGSLQVVPDGGTVDLGAVGDTTCATNIGLSAGNDYTLDVYATDLAGNQSDHAKVHVDIPGGCSERGAKWGELDRRRDRGDLCEAQQQHLEVAIGGLRDERRVVGRQAALVEDGGGARGELDAT